MIEQFETEFLNGVRQRQGMDELRQLLVAAAARGLTQVEVQAALERVRRKVEQETLEDVVLEALDLVTGFCAPQHRIAWPTTTQQD